MKMEKKERVLAAIQKEEVDRPPFGMWYHVPHVDQDPVHLAEIQIQQAQDYDLDFIKLMPFGNYSAADFGLSCTYHCTADKPVFERKFAIEDPKEWSELKPLPGIFGNHGKTVMIAQQVARQQKKAGLELPFVQTVFSPLTTAKKLAGMRLFQDMRSHPQHVHAALAAITETSINFVVENLNAGVAGFFFATQCATRDWVTEDEYKEFGLFYDLKVIEAFTDSTFFNILHIHGDNTWFNLLATYPVHCLNWHDRWSEPDLATARKISDKCFMGGINEIWLKTAKPEQIVKHIREAVIAAGIRGLMITPGCVADPTTPVENFIACREALGHL